MASMQDGDGQTSCKRQLALRWREDEIMSVFKQTPQFKPNGFAVTGFVSPPEHPVAYVKFGFPSERMAEASDGILIPEIYRTFESGQRFFIVMDYIHGRTLVPLQEQQDWETRKGTVIDSIARAIRLLTSIKAPPGQGPGPVGGGRIRHPLFNNGTSFCKYSSVDELERHLNKVSTLKYKTAPTVNLERDLYFYYSDFFPGNFIFTDAGDLCLIDFDEAGLLPPSFMSYALAESSWAPGLWVKDKIRLPEHNLDAMKSIAYWFAIGVSNLEVDLLHRVSRANRRRRILHTSFAFPSGPENDGGGSNAGDIVPHENGLVHTVLRAFQQDLHLTLRPDDVWLAILTQFTFFINGSDRAERLRFLFVPHDQRKGLVLSLYPYTLAEFGVARAARCMADLVKESLVDEDIAARLMPEFTTTTDNDRSTAAIVFLGSMRKYFDYFFDEGCGFPSVTLLGERGDWASMLERVAWIASLGPSCGDDEQEVVAWTRCLTKALEGMVASFDRPGDIQTKDFWMRACHTGGEQNSGGTITLSGWLTAFCWWAADGARQEALDDDELEEANIGCLGDERTCRLLLDGVEFPVIDRDKIPGAVTHVPVTLLEISGNVVPLLFLAGLTGMQLEDEEATRLKLLNMGILVKLVGSGLGLASEAIHDYRARSRSQSRQDQPPSPGVPTSSSSSRTPEPSSGEAPPDYAELADEASVNRLVQSGQAERVSDYAGAKEDRPKASVAGYPDEGGDGYSSDEDPESAQANDEAAWELDEMAERVAPPSRADSETAAAVGEGESEEVKVEKEEQMIRELLRMAGPPPQPVRRLPCPVIIPQRRPRNKDRGFVKAYAPVLDECGVGQDVFLKFLKSWLAACKTDPWIDVLFIAAGVVGMLPEVAAKVVGTVVQVAAGTAKELQSRTRRNTFLDRVNQELFMPRGLYAMVMAFKDEVPGQQPRGPLSKLAGVAGKALFSKERLDINQTVAKYSNPDPDMSRMKKGLQNIRLVSGRTHGEIELPEAAALVYPDIDRAAQKDLDQEGNGKGTEDESMKEKWKGAGKWVQDYLDRKAQASYELEHQGSSLTVPSTSRPAFASRYSDPNHPANSGSLISLLTGGAVNPAGRRQERRSAKQDRKAMRREYKDQRRIVHGKSPRGPRRVRLPKGQRKGIIKKVLQQDVLYLLIVNLPTEQEVQESVADLERVMGGQNMQTA
ncbi:hypothetical protein VMCG_04838 [Cytospora schulzeri]|uniref:Aminoglycoside phosphotransferase domain-containing protein n=1 Tax=Cytospora schulzeri TaxID=448051 RepID=A0A423WMW6_9PEZI|nr:hypothetical protein VMCG_04838 [Valsa malicola]